MFEACTMKHEPGRLQNTIQEMKRLNISILGISEMRWPMSGKSNVDGYEVYYSGEDSLQYRNGIPIIISPETNKSVKNVVLISDRIIMLQIQTTTVDMNPGICAY